jgi:hypothetical protein
MLIDTPQLINASNRIRRPSSFLVLIKLTFCMTCFALIKARLAEYPP